MTCLSDERIFLLSEGDGTPNEVVHLHGCVRCARRLHDLTATLDLVGRTLRDAPLPATPTRRPTIAGVAWQPFAAGVALAAGLLLAWGLLPDRELPSTTAPNAVALNDLSSALFASDDSTWRSDADTDALYFAAAFRGEDPCERQTGTDAIGCR